MPYYYIMVNKTNKTKYCTTKKYPLRWDKLEDKEELKLLKMIQSLIEFNVDLQWMISFIN